MSHTVPHIVVIGGGAGGLELVTRLGHQFGKRGKARVTLVDRSPTHIWKPLLHEVATGSLDSGIDEVSYRGHARAHHFHFQLGTLTGIDRTERQLTLAPINDDSGTQVVPGRTLQYDYLVLALGSQSNDFGTPGVAQHCNFLDSREQAERFRQKLLNQFLRLSVQNRDQADHPARLTIAIVGAGATGVELSAELHNAARMIGSFGFEGMDKGQLDVHLIEAGPRILPALSERISASAHLELTKIGVKVRTGTRIVEATEQGLHTAEGETISADLMVWAAGIKAPAFLAQLDGLETNRINQVMVHPSLQSLTDERIFAIGDCAGCPIDDNRWVPPRAQAAHQMASHLIKNLKRLFNQQPMQPFVYKDHGSLVSLSRFSTVGSLMGNLTSGSFFIEGHLARMFYVSLYRMHQLALHGPLATLLMAFVEHINKVLRPRLKLH
ncbi:NAD(P)/FAD-dependent oxidoreductase [Pokkaliibacter sp. MBI-7]|uniref:NAD(P)/FAD-dependent oxidoreductase n=1 Tax=Pokkaliibacter sp. MBI-7 TaxID=3040600 RepID=UPI00244D49E6|nr:NAD(P)/FAD-dependent oxidoreductase [Pokkaliibacter sp. MBI-7]MDH2434328.1 NAD(P)/FAD-dependent oxidoreductase [Pokkaliibacter sp. MBI-7]